MRFQQEPKRFLFLILGLLGLVDSAYLTWVKLASATVACSNVGDCESVNNSIYSEIGGIPIALVGALGYVALLAAFLLEDQWRERKEILLIGQFGMAMVGTLYSAYLTYIELAVLQAVCPYCVLSALTITGMMVISGIRWFEFEPD